MMIWPEAACHGIGPEVFYPDTSISLNATPYRICRGCPVRERCLEHALEHREEFGIWGGLNEKARKSMRRKRQRQRLMEVT